MAEVVGVVASGITIANLFKVCLDVIDLIQTARHQDLDVKKLVLKLNIEKCRLYAWGEAVGLTGTLVPGQTRPLDAFPAHVEDLVRDTLEMTIYLFTDTQKLKNRYGCKELLLTEACGPALARGNGFGPSNKLATTFSHFKVADASPDKLARLLLKTRWTIHDRKKFLELVAEVKTFVDGLQNLTQPLFPAIQQESTVRKGVQRINDVETLDLIADVCEADHPAIADAASEISATISSTALLDIEQWTPSVIPELEDEIADLESLTVTELKHRILAQANEKHVAAREAKWKSDLRRRQTPIVRRISTKIQEYGVLLRFILAMGAIFLPIVSGILSSLRFSLYILGADSILINSPQNSLFFSYAISYMLASTVAIWLRSSIDIISHPREPYDLASSKLLKTPLSKLNSNDRDA